MRFGSERVAADLVEHDPAADLGEAVVERAGVDHRAASLADLDRAAELGGEAQRGGAGRLVLGDAGLGREDALADRTPASSSSHAQMPALR